MVSVSTLPEMERYFKDLDQKKVSPFVEYIPDASATLFTSDNLVAGFSPASMTLVSKLFMLFQVAYSVESLATLTTHWKKGGKLLINLPIKVHIKVL